MTRAVHTFDNGIRVFDDQIASVQRERYARKNVHEAEEEGLFLEIIRALEPYALFLNIGSAIGYYAMLAKKTAPGLSVHVVEPLPRFRRHFLDNIALNGFSREDFTIHEEGVCASVGTASYVDRGFGSRIRLANVGKGSGAAHAGDGQRKRPVRQRWLRGILRRFGQRRRGSAKTSAQTITIPTITLDVLMDRIGAPVALCQMDVQGLELEVLQGGRKTLSDGSVTTFLIGTHSPELHRDCLGLLRADGYEVAFDQQKMVDQPDGIIMATKHGNCGWIA